MSATPPPRRPHGPAAEEPKKRWELASADHEQREPLEGELHDATHLLAIITTAIALLALAIAILLLAT